jgi:hypothetical protein
MTRTENTIWNRILPRGQELSDNIIHAGGARFAFYHLPKARNTYSFQGEINVSADERHHAVARRQSRGSDLPSVRRQLNRTALMARSTVLRGKLIVFSGRIE